MTTLTFIAGLFWLGALIIEAPHVPWSEAKFWAAVCMVLAVVFAVLAGVIGK